MNRKEELERALLKREVEWRRCAADPAYFFANYWHVKVPGSSPLFKLREPQMEALKNWIEHPFTISLKARQIGWTTLAAAYAFHCAFFQSDYPILALSRTERYAKKLLKMAKYGYTRMPQWMIDRGPALVQENQTFMEFENASTIESLPSRDNAARGETAGLIIVDEWAFFVDPEEAWASIEPATDIGGRIIGISTARGFGNWFHNLYVGAREGTNDFKSMFFPWSAVPDRDEEWYRKKVRNTPGWQMAQEYPTIDDEAFVQSGNPVYKMEMLKANFDLMDPLLSGELIEDKDNGLRFSVLADEDEQSLSVWEKPEGNFNYVIGADVASGSDGGDYSTAHVINVVTRRVVATYQARIAPERFADDLDRLGRWYNTAYLGVERNNHGLSVLTRLLEERSYSNLHLHTRDNVSRSVTRNAGWITSQTTKPLMIDKLGEALRTRQLALHCEETLTELIAFSREVSRSGNEQYNGKPHDDLVISLAISVMMLREVRPEAPAEPVPEKGVSFDMFERLAVQAGLSDGASDTYNPAYEPGAKKSHLKEGFFV